MRAGTRLVLGSRSDACFSGGRYWVRTSDLFGVNEARYHCANRPLWWCWCCFVCLAGETLAHHSATI